MAKSLLSLARENRCTLREYTYSNKTELKILITNLEKSGELLIFSDTIFSQVNKEFDDNKGIIAGIYFPYNNTGTRAQCIVLRHKGDGENESGDI